MSKNKQIHFSEVRTSLTASLLLDLGIVINEKEPLNADTWDVIATCLQKLFQEYPEVSSGLLKRINIINPQYKFLCAVSFPFDDKDNNYGIASGLDLDLSYIRFANPSNMKEKLEATNIDIKPEDMVEFMIAHAFGMVLEINLAIMSGLIDPKKETKAKYEEFLYTLPFSKKITDNVLKDVDKSNAADLREFLKKEVSDTAALSTNELFSEAVAFHYFGKDNEITGNIMKEYKKMVKEIRKGHV